VNATRSATPSSRAVVDRLLLATNGHDLDALVDCFASDYLNETPVHPLRAFTGNEQVRRNWTQIFAAVPDLVAEVTAQSEDGVTAWTEWQMSGTRGDGTRHLMRGVIIFTVLDDRIRAARFYLEPVETSNGDVNAAVRAQMTGRP
jgi:ketosteroid isomerase-like protein